MNENEKEFREALKVNVNGITTLNPNIVDTQTKNDIHLEFIRELVGTENERLIAYTDPYVKQLIDYVKAAILFEGKFSEEDENSFNYTISERTKSLKSLRKKIEQKGVVTDYLGMKIIPTGNPDILSSAGDTTLDKMLKEREKIRKFIKNKYKMISSNKMISFSSYIQECIEVYNKIIATFPPEATEVIGHYERRKQTLNDELENYKRIFGDEDVEKPISTIMQNSTFNLHYLLNRLKLKNNNKIILYVLKKNVMQTLEHSDIIQNLGVSVAETRSKSKANGYRSEFIILNLNVPVENGEPLNLPIEVQLLTRERSRDEQYGLSAHIYREGKQPDSLPKYPRSMVKKKELLKNSPKHLHASRYTDTEATAEQYREYLEYKNFYTTIQNMIPEINYAEVRDKRVVITHNDVYGNLAQILNAERGTQIEKMYDAYLNDIYDNRDVLLPDSTPLTSYYREFDLPNNASIRNDFMKKLAHSVSQTMHDARTKVNVSSKTNKSKDDGPRIRIRILIYPPLIN